MLDGSTESAFTYRCDNQSSRRWRDVRVDGVSSRRWREVRVDGVTIGVGSKIDFYTGIHDYGSEVVDLAAPVRVHQERFAEKVVQDAIVSENDVVDVV